MYLACPVLGQGVQATTGRCNHMVAIEGLTLPHTVEHPISLAMPFSLEQGLGLMDVTMN